MQCIGLMGLWGAFGWLPCAVVAGGNLNDFWVVYIGSFCLGGVLCHFHFHGWPKGYRKYGFEASKVNQSLQQASALNSRNSYVQQLTPEKQATKDRVETATAKRQLIIPVDFSEKGPRAERLVVWLNTEQTRYRYSDDPAWLTRNCRPGQPDCPPRSLGTNRPTEPQVQRGPRGGRYYVVRSKNGQRYRKYF